LNATSQAVFISYTSQDAESAGRICEALRAAGIQVWFDQSELRGGDVWDQKIGTVAHALGSVNDALQLYQQADALDPVNWAVQERLADAY
jgi:hypothetical protein